MTDMINFIFHSSVDALTWPILTFLLMYAVFYLIRQNRELREEAHV